MTWVLVRKLLRDVRLALIIVALILLGFQILWVKVTQRAVTQLSPLFATLADRAGIMQKALEEQIFAGPGKLVQTMAGGDTLHFERATDMLTIGYVHPLMQAIFCIWAVGRAASALAGEIDRGTMELLLAQPISRGRIVLAHLFVDAIALPILCLAPWMGTMIGYNTIGPFDVKIEEAQAQLASLPFKVVVDPELLKAEPSSFLPAMLNVVALMFAVSGVTMALSARGRFRGRVLGVAVLTLLLMFIVNVIGQMWDTASVLRPFTLFYYYQPQQIILNGRWSAETPVGRVNVLIVLFGVGAIGYTAAWRIFSRRDLPAPL